MPRPPGFSSSSSSSSSRLLLKKTRLRLALGAFFMSGIVLHLLESENQARILLKLKTVGPSSYAGSTNAIRNISHVTRNDSYYSTSKQLRSAALNILDFILPEEDIEQVVVVVQDSNNHMTNNRTKVILFPYLKQETGVGFLEGWPGVSNTESKQIELDGIRESPYLELSTNLDKDMLQTEQSVVWVGDTIGRFHPSAGTPGANEETWCEAFGKLIRKAQMDRYCHTNGQQQDFKNDSMRMTVQIVDWGDMHYHPRCHNIEYLVGESNVKYSKRGRVEGRQWNDEKQWIDVGTRKSFFALEGRPYHEIPLTVRTDTVEAIDYTLATRYNNENINTDTTTTTTTTKGNIKLTDPIESVLPRPYDVICLWPLKNSEEASHIGAAQQANFRFRVSEVVSNVGHEHNLQHFVGLAGKATQIGRWGIMMEYIEKLLSTKIVVVANRDMWEDHYRLMEALISGALVMTDKWVVLPPGLQDGTSVVEFTSAQDLEDKILYYLEHEEERVKIAGEGRRVAMSEHRTWHRMEQIVFNEIRSKCDSDDRDCIYRVHVDASIPTNCTELKNGGETVTVLECLSWKLKPNS